MQAAPHQQILEADHRNLDGSVTVEYQRCVSEGGYAKVYRGLYQTLSVTVCVKALNHVSDDLVNPESNLIRRFIREVKIWCDLDHSHVVKSYGWISFIRARDEPNPSLVLSWCEGGDVKKFLGSNPNADRQNLICGVLHGLAYLHLRNIVHGDVRQENVVITSEGNAQLCDFGLSSILGDSSTNLSGSSVTPEPRYASPELLEGGSRDRRSDVWAFGCTSMGILSGRNPYHQQLIVWGVIAAINRGTLPYEWDTSSHFQSVIGFCFQRNANDRPTIETIVEQFEPGSLQAIIPQWHREQLLAAVNQELEQQDRRNLGGHIELGLGDPGMDGDVYEGVYNNKTVRVKALRVININVEVMLRFVLQFKEYMSTLCDLMHPNLVEMHGWALSVVGGEQLRAQVISRSCGDIETHLRQHPDTDCRVWIREICYALSYLHEKSIVHGNIRPSNVMIGIFGTVQLCDFGLSSIFSETLGSPTLALGGPLSDPRFRAPELVAIDGVRACDTRGDIWAFGCTAGNLLDNRQPYYTIGDGLVVSHGIRMGVSPYDWTDADKIREVLQSCFARNPDARPPIRTLVNELQDV